jgi:hypothetical protein
MYRLTTPVSIAIDLSVQNTYNPESKTALIVRGVLNAISTGVLIYSGLVELLARDFLFDPCRTKRRSHLLFMVFRTLLGAGIMALIGKVGIGNSGMEISDCIVSEQFNCSLVNPSHRSKFGILWVNFYLLKKIKGGRRRNPRNQQNPFMLLKL